MPVKSLTITLILFTLLLTPSAAVADFCVKNNTGKKVDLFVACGLSHYKDMFNALKKSVKDKDVPAKELLLLKEVKPGKKLCKSNKILFVPMPCGFAALGSSQLCMAGPMFNSKAITSINTTAGKLPVPICRYK